MYKVEKYGLKFSVVKYVLAVESGFIDYDSAKLICDKMNCLI